MPRVRVVLVRPEASVNVGACARLVKNTGCAGLDLVAPGDFRSVECWRTAWGAHEVLEQARVFERLAPALEETALAVAFTGRRRSDAPSVADVRDAAAAATELGPDDRAALVFGPEASGLTNEELSLCGRVARIPADPAQPSYNLSHAVAIAAYEVLRASRPGSSRQPRPLATHGQKERLLALLERGLQAAKALPATGAPAHFTPWRELVQRLDLAPSELELLEHLARKLARPAR